MNKWKTIHSKTVFQHPRLSLAEDTVELPDGSRVPYLKHISRHDSAMIVCKRDDKFLLQREYSYPPNQVLYQFPGGKVEKGESPKQAAARELVEEAGLESDQLTALGWFYVDNRRSDAKMHVYLVTDPSEVEKRGGDLEEEITSHWVTLAELNDMLKRGEIVNGTLLSAWSLYLASIVP